MMPHIVPTGHRYYTSSHKVEVMFTDDDTEERKPRTTSVVRRRKDIVGQVMLCNDCFAAYEKVVQTKTAPTGDGVVMYQEA